MLLSAHFPQLNLDLPPRHRLVMIAMHLPLRGTHADPLSPVREQSKTRLLTYQGSYILQKKRF